MNTTRPLKSGCCFSAQAAPQQHRGMAIVTAGVHLARRLRGVGKPGLFTDIQGIDIGPKADRFTFTLLTVQRGDHARSSDSSGHFKAPLTEQRGDTCTRALLLERRFRMLVEIVSPSGEFFTIRQGY